ncbi:MAG: DUF2892 domain-containing protein [Anaerolineae bacterium]|nr:DUF2892 domain-containing protein [Anaerolineae bacterium]
MMNLRTLKADEVNVREGERWLSLIAGAVLTIAGIAQKSLGGSLLALAGGYLLYRGARGHCYIYDLLGIDQEPYATMLPADTPPPPSVDQGDEVLESSWESFPTSDAPSWTMGRESSEDGG